MENELQQRSTPDGLDISQRSAPVSPSSVDEKERSVEVVAATEGRVTVMDRQSWELVEEILLMSGAQLPESRQIPLIDSHYRGETSGIIGSARELRVEGDKLVGRAFFTSQPEGEGPFQKIKEGHLTDFSVGYRVDDVQRVAEGETLKIDGRTFDGPVNVVTRWTPKELSTVVIGADPDAKARAESEQNIKSEERGMNEELKRLLVARGLAQDADDAMAQAFLLKLLQSGQLRVDEVPGQGNGQRNEPAPEKEDPEAQRTAGQDLAIIERQRVLEIQSMCRAFGFEDLENSLVNTGAGLESARKAVLERQLSLLNQQPGPSHQANVEVTRTEQEKFRSAVEDSLALRCGLTVETPAAGANELRGYTMVELAREVLRREGHRVPGDRLEMVGRALTTSDLPNLLVSTARRSLLAGWERANEQWQLFADDSGNLPDFKEMTLARASEFGDLEKIAEDGEYKHDKLEAIKESVKLATMGKMFAISRQAIINDDLGAISNIPMIMGESAARSVGDIAWGVVIDNNTMGDGIALYHADHGNLVAAGSGGVPGVDSFGTAEASMQLQRDIRGKRRLNIIPVFYLAPVALKGYSRQFFATKGILDTTTSEVKANTYAERFTEVYEARLDDASETAWYLLAQRGKTVKVFFLNGNKTPYLEQRQGWDRDGTEFKVRIDAAAMALDYRGFYRNDGR